MSLFKMAQKIENPVKCNSLQVYLSAKNVIPTKIRLINTEVYGTGTMEESIESLWV